MFPRPRNHDVETEPHRLGVFFVSLANHRVPTYSNPTKPGTILSARSRASFNSYRSYLSWMQEKSREGRTQVWLALCLICAGLDWN